MRVRKAIAALSTLGLAMLGTAVTAPAAHAGAYGCSGNYSWSSDVPGVNGGTVGTIYDYWDGTYNCSVFVKSVYVGAPTYMSLDIYARNNNHDSKPGTTSNDSGNYSSYAGPVTINGVGTCVSEVVEMYDPTNNILAQWETPWHSC